MASIRKPHSLLFPVLGLLLVLGLATINSFSELFSMERLGLLASVAVLGFLVYSSLFVERGRFDLDCFRPESVYGFFYLIYYGLPGLLLCVTSFVPAVLEHYQVEVGVAIVVGYLAFLAGITLRRWQTHGKGVKATFNTLTTQEAFAVIAVCYVCIAFLMWHFIWRVQYGNFYEHGSANPFEIEHNAETSIVFVFVNSLYLPVPLLLAAAMRNPNAALRRHATLLLFLVSGGLAFIFTISSQFRYAFTVLMLLLISLKTASKIRVSLKQVAVVCVIGLVLLATIRTMRSQDAGRMMSSRSQLADAVDLAREGIVSMNVDTVANSATVDRASNSLRFLAEIVDATQRGYPLLMGSYIVDRAPTLIPKIIWRDKPPTISAQIYLRQLFGLTVHDDAPAALVMFYANFGWMGIIFGFLMLGWFLKWMMDREMGPKEWIVAAFAWSATIQIEQEVIVTLATALRSALVILVIYSLFKWAADLLIRDQFTQRRVVFHRLSHHGAE